MLFGLLHDPVYSPSVVLIIFIFKATTLYPSKRKNSDKEGEFYFRFVICSSLVVLFDTFYICFPQCFYERFAMHFNHSYITDHVCVDPVET